MASIRRCCRTAATPPTGTTRCASWKRSSASPKTGSCLRFGAEGVGSWGWLGKPLYAFEALAEPRTFGKSHHPFDCACASRRVEYGPGLCPNAERMLRETLVMTVHEFYREEDVDDMAAAVHKVAARRQAEIE